MTKKDNTFMYVVLGLALFVLVFTVIIALTPDKFEIEAAQAAQQTEPDEDEQPRYMPIEYNFVLDIEDKYKIYDPDELTPEIMENRTQGDTLIIERVIGKVTNKSTGDGRIINTADTYYNYISYKNVDFHIEDGTEILTYFIYNPDNNYVDDVVDRFDFVYNREGED